MDQSVKLRAGAAADRLELLESLIAGEAAAAAECLGKDWFVGRVLSEATEEGKDPKVPISTHSLVLESSNEKRVKLMISECAEYLVYAGQILGAVGTLNKDEFHAIQLVTAPVPDLPPTTQALTTSHLLVASGPYSPDSMLLFDSLAELEVQVRAEAPDVLVLMGPLLDAGHPVVASGTVQDSFGRASTFEAVYTEEIFPKLSRLARACETAKTRLLIVPAVNEARFDFPLPQPPINTSTNPLWTALVKELPASVQFCSNPVSVELGGTHLLISSTDALSSLNSSLLFKQAPEGSGRVETCLREMLSARTLFPLMPSAVRIDPARRSALDFSTMPSVVISPSLSGRRFVKTVAGRTFVNPGFLSDATGTTSSLAKIVLAPNGVSAEILKL